MPAHMTWPDHLLDLDEWSALPEDPSWLIELAEGVLLVSPRPLVRHQKLVRLLLTQLHVGARGRWQALSEIAVVIDDGSPATVRVPDLVLAQPDVPDDAPRVDAATLLAAVEVLSPGTRRLDSVLKLHEYAIAGIPVYLLVEPGPPTTLTEYRLVDGTYASVAEHAGRAHLGLGVVLDLDAPG